MFRLFCLLLLVGSALAVTITVSDPESQRPTGFLLHLVERISTLELAQLSQQFSAPPEWLWIDKHRAYFYATPRDVQKTRWPSVTRSVTELSQIPHSSRRTRRRAGVHTDMISITIPDSHPDTEEWRKELEWHMRTPVQMHRSPYLAVYYCDAPNFHPYAMKFFLGKPGVYFVSDSKVPTLLGVEGNNVVLRNGQTSGHDYLFSLEQPSEQIGILDTGIQMQHSFFDDPVLGNHGIYTTSTHPTLTDHRKVPAYVYSFSSDTTDGPYTDDGHGTHVVGIATGVPVSSIATCFGQRGVSPMSKVVFLDIMKASSPDMLQIPSMQTIASVFDSTQTRILSSSYGAPDSSYDSELMAIDQYLFAHPDTLWTFAGGNDDRIGSIYNYCYAKNTICVGASFAHDFGSVNYRTVAPDSKGPLVNGRIKPDLVAPGWFVKSSGSRLQDGACTVVTMSGTSMATPLVAGSVAVLRRYFREQSQNISGIGAKAMLIQAAGYNPMVNAYHDDGSVEMLSQVSHREYYEGYGLLVLSSVLPDPANPTFQTVIVDRNHTLIATNDTVVFDVSVTSDSAKPFHVTMAYYDRPSGSNGLLVDDLDLVVHDISRGKSYTGNQDIFFTGSLADRMHTQEQVRVPDYDDTPTTYRVAVGAYHLTGPQTFAIVFTAKTVSLNITNTTQYADVIPNTEDAQFSMSTTDSASRTNTMLWVIIGCSIGGFVLLAFMGLVLYLWIRQRNHTDTPSKRSYATLSR